MKPRIEDQQIISQWQSIVEILARVIHVPSAIITRVTQPYVEVFKASHTPDNPYSEGMKVKMAGHYCQEVIASNRELLVTDARKIERWKEAPEIKYGMVSYLGYPISWPDGEVFGTICVLDNKENHYSTDYQDLLAQFKAMVESHLQIVIQNHLLTLRLEEIKKLQGMLPICAYCKKIRNEDGGWEQMETYIHRRSEADFSHTVCPACMESVMAEIEN